MLEQWWFGGAVLGVSFLLATIAALLALPGPGSWVKQDGTIVEWDGKGGGRVLHPDGRLEEFHA